MAKPSRKAASKKQSKPRKNDPPLSLYGMSFLQAVDTALATKPAKPKPKKRLTIISLWL